MHDCHGKKSIDYTTKIRAGVCGKSYDSGKTSFNISVNTGQICNLISLKQISQVNYINIPIL